MSLVSFYNLGTINYADFVRKKQFSLKTSSSSPVFNCFVFLNIKLLAAMGIG